MTQMEILEQLDRGEIPADQAIARITQDAQSKKDNNQTDQDNIKNSRAYERKGNFMKIRVISENHHHFSLPFPLLFIYAGFVFSKASIRIAAYFAREGKIRETSNILENVHDADFMRMLEELRFYKERDFIQVISPGNEVSISIT